MLFMICTGRSPHPGKTTLEVLNSIVNSEVPSPRSLLASVPKPLDAICQKALAKKKEDRYESALRLQEDLKRWLADEPVSVYRETWWEGCGRWFRRHRAAAVSSIAVLAGVAVVSIMAAFLINQARIDKANALTALKDANQKEQEARTIAEQRRKQALDAISRWQVDLADVMRHHPRIQALREGLLEQAADEYDQLAPELKSQPEVHLERVRIYLRLGDVRRRLDKPKEARTAYERAEQELEELISDAEDKDNLLLQLAKCLAAKSDTWQVVGEMQTAESEFRRALTTLEKVENQSAKSVNYVETKTGIQQQLAELLITLRRFDEAKEILNAALMFAEQDPNTRSQRSIVQLRAIVHNALARVELAMSQYSNAESHLDKAISLWSGLVNAYREDPIGLEGRTNALVLRANVYRQLGKSGQELKDDQVALSDYQALHDALPDIPRYRYQIVVGQINLAQIFHRHGKNEEAYNHAGQALESIKNLVKAFPDSPVYYATEATARATLGHILRELQEWDIATAAFESASEIRSQLAEKYPDQPAY
ncbi:MAG: hypothetical protein KDA84_27850, partial [Planctomycetaceae bacterium]|nr:hypothetical protein [Planctomycetaceae bacterium]